MTQIATSLHFGWLAEQRMAWPDLHRHALIVEQLGYDGIWASDHLADDDDQWLLDAWTSLGALLATVPRIEAGTLVASNTLRQPLLTAHMARTLAEIAPGRFVLGLGAGGDRSEHLRVGSEFQRIGKRTEALRGACELISRVTAAGSPWSATPLHNRTMPLLVGGGGRGSMRVAADFADRWTIWGSPSVLAAKGAILNEFVRDAGRAPTDIRRGAIVMLLPAHLGERNQDFKWPATLAGDAETVHRQLLDYVAVGVTDIIVCDYAIDPRCRLEGLRWFAEIMADFKTDRAGGSM